MAITCCNGCVPPKRHGECHTTCPEYTQQKAQHEAERERINKIRDVSNEIYSQRGASVRKANRRRRGN